MENLITYNLLKTFFLFWMRLFLLLQKYFPRLYFFTSIQSNLFFLVFLLLFCYESNKNDTRNSINLFWACFLEFVCFTDWISDGNYVQGGCPICTVWLQSKLLICSHDFEFHNWAEAERLFLCFIIIEW